MAKIKISSESGGPNDGVFNAKNLVASDRSGISNAQLLDGINNILATGGKPSSVDYTIAKKIGPHAEKLLQDAYIWRTANPNIGKSPEERINAYFGREINPSNPIDYYRGQLRNIGNSAVSSYWNSPNIALQGMQGVKTPAMDALRNAPIEGSPAYSSIMYSK